MAESRETALAIAHEFLQKRGELPSSPAVGSRLLELANKPIETVEVQQLLRLVQLDPALSIKVLQLANSVYFGGIEPIDNLRQAIIRVGLEESLNFVQAVFYRSFMPAFPSLQGYFSDRDHWLYCQSCAVSGKILAHPKGGSSLLPGELYLSGLLQGCGRLALALTRPEALFQAMENSRAARQPLAMAELEVIGTTDAEVAAELLRVWKLPPKICAAVRWMYHPDGAPEEFCEAARMLQLACCIVNTAGIGNIMDEFSFDLSRTWIARSGTTPLAGETLRNEFVEDIHAVLRRRKKFFTSFGDEKQEEGEEPEEATDQVEPVPPPPPAEPEGMFARLLQWLLKLLAGGAAQ